MVSYLRYAWLAGEEVKALAGDGRWQFWRDVVSDEGELKIFGLASADGRDWYMLDAGLDAPETLVLHE